MTSRDFCYWLQGFFEVTENQKPYVIGTEREPIELTEQQIKTIRAHLNLVFNHEIDPKNLEGKSELEKKIYDKIHDGVSKDSIKADIYQGGEPYTAVYNC